MASYIGKPISLISQSDIRYRGILHNVDPAQQTIQLANVLSMGTENRRPVTEYIPPYPLAYDFILFRAPEVKDISVETTAPPPPPVNNVQNDPAVIGVSQGSAPTQGYDGYAYNSTNPAVNVPPVSGSVPVSIPAQASAPAPVPVPVSATTTSHLPAQVTQTVSSQPPRRREANGRHSNTNTIRTALQSVERAMGDLRIEAARNGKRADQIQTGNIHVPATDFDFESANAKFDKAALAKPLEESESDSESDAETNPSNAGDKREKDKKGKEPAYNPSKSFFDSLTPNSLPARGGGQGHGGGRGGRGRGGYGRSRREEEAQRNLMTFGETMPLSQPSWSGGRRGGRRGGSAGVLGGYPTRGVATNGRPG